MPRAGATRRCGPRSSTPSTTRRARTPCSATTARCSSARREWHDTGDPAAYERWDAARRAFEASAAAHEAAYAGDPYYPAYNLTAAELGVERAERDLPMAWAARVLLVLLAAWLGYGIASRLRAACAGPVRAPPARSGWRPRGRGAPPRSTEGLGRADRVLVVARARRRARR